MIEELEEKECTKCFEELPATTEFFYRFTRSYDGLSSQCKACSDTCTRLRRQRMKTLNRLKKERYMVFTPFRLLKYNDKEGMICD